MASNNDIFRYSYAYNCSRSDANNLSNIIVLYHHLLEGQNYDIDLFYRQQDILSEIYELLIEVDSRMKLKSYNSVFSKGEVKINSVLECLKLDSIWLKNRDYINQYTLDSVYRILELFSYHFKKIKGKIITRTHNNPFTFGHAAPFKIRDIE